MAALSCSSPPSFAQIHTLLCSQLWSGIKWSPGRLWLSFGRVLLRLVQLQLPILWHFASAAMYCYAIALASLVLE